MPAGRVLASALVANPTDPNSLHAQPSPPAQAPVLPAGLKDGPLVALVPFSQDGLQRLGGLLQHAGQEGGLGLTDCGLRPLAGRPPLATCKRSAPPARRMQADGQDYALSVAAGPRLFFV